MPFCVGLTGGIGSGKSAAGDMFAALGITVVDTDAIARELTAPGGAAMAAIQKAFGDEYVCPDGSLDRARMRTLVFGNPAAKQRLESILHPIIRSTGRSRILAATSPYAMLAVPLLLETGGYPDLVQRVLVVDCSEELQIDRVMKRSGLKQPEVVAIMATQMPRKDRLARADDVLVNDRDLNSLREAVSKLHRTYLAISEHPAT